MDSRFVVLLVLGALLGAESCDKPKPCCGKNEHYVENCNECERNCNTILEPKDKCKICDPYTGCICNEGYVRDKTTGACKKQNDCPPPYVCGCNEIWKWESKECNRTCENGGKPCDTCDKGPGCYCKDSYVEDKKTGKCVKPCDCTKKCPKNEVYKVCGTACPRTCTNRNESIICSDICVPGCFCEDDLVRDENGNCICPKDCKCLPGEIYKKKPGKTCCQTCSNYGKPCCWKDCKPGCYCPDGKIRDEKSGKCVDPKDCPKCGCNDDGDGHDHDN